MDTKRASKQPPCHPTGEATWAAPYRGRAARPCFGQHDKHYGFASRRRANVTLLGVCLQGSGGEGGIRTHVTLSRKPHFECGAFDHSATSPGAVREADNRRPRSRARYLAASPRRRKPPVRFLSKLFCGQPRGREIIRLQPKLAAAWRADFAAGLRPDRQSLLRSTEGKRGPDSGGEGGRPARMATRSAAAASSGSGRKASAAVRRAMKSS